ncbi:MAG: DUF4303 domain-containing protein [Spirulina sp. SIO3F2]|nr:DUF4303 domain-containing protein [Spirulina sp. SIO3F2]
MDEFKHLFNQSVLRSFSRFIHKHGDERPYALAISTGQTCNYLGFAVATEEKLVQTARDYAAELSYRYEAHKWENDNLQEKLQIWLRWSNPDDGWYYKDFDNSDKLQQFLKRLSKQENCDEQLECLCIESLRLLVRETVWQELTLPFSTTIGITPGENPDDFLRTATMINDYSTTMRLWSEYHQIRELDARLGGS